MPSPFPGMDPYLEDPGLWPDVHARLIAIASEFLGQTIRPKYYVRIEQRVYISDETDVGRPVMVPDLRIAYRPAHEGSTFVPGGGTAVEVAEPIEAITMIEEEIGESYIEIVDRLDRSVVTVIEILSPTNKVAGSRGRESYDRKRLEVMKSPTSLVEIDLLRTGLPIPVYGGIPPHEYLVHVSLGGERPGGKRPAGKLWPIRLSQRLPAISVPLKPEDGFVALDLQAVLNTAYDRAGYDLELDYRADPIPPLEGEWNAWAHRLLQEKGLRPE
jgi:uncharacterized protein DUF4058